MSIRDTWSTPDCFYNPLDSLFNFELDVCATQDNARCNYYLSPGNEILGKPGPVCLGVNGLTSSWFKKRCFCNPGYSNAAPWFDKSIVEAHHGSVTVILTHACTGSEWWQRSVKWASELWVLTPRIPFVPPEGVKASSNSRDSILTVYTPWGINRGTGPQLVNFNWREYGQRLMGGKAV